MAVENITIREHTTDDITMQLLSDGVAIDLSGVDHVRLDIIDNQKKTYRYSSDDVSPAVTISDATNGKVTLTPPDETLFQYQKHPYRLYIWVYTTASKRYSVPEKGYGEIKLEKEY